MFGCILIVYYLKGLYKMINLDSVMYIIRGGSIPTMRLITTIVIIHALGLQTFHDYLLGGMISLFGIAWISCYYYDEYRMKRLEDKNGI